MQITVVLSALLVLCGQICLGLLQDLSSPSRFWTLRNAGESADDVLGKHIEFSINFEQGTVEIVADKLQKDAVNVQVVSGNIFLTENDLNKLDDEIAAVKARLEATGVPRLAIALKFLEYTRWAYPGHVIRPRNNTYTVENVYDEDDLEDLIQQRLMQSLSANKARNQVSTAGPTVLVTRPKIILDFSTKRPTTRKPTTRKPTSRAPTRAPTWKCGDEFLSKWDSSPYVGAPCPKYSSLSVPNRKNTIVCLCPYNGVNGATALFDGFDKNNQKKTLSWKVKYGSATKDCIGRCGPTCRDWDKEATLDCLAHDLCINFFGGSTTFFNPNCNNEVDNGLDDVAATLFSVCC